MVAAAVLAELTTKFCAYVSNLKSYRNATVSHVVRRGKNTLRHFATSFLIVLVLRIVKGALSTICGTEPGASIPHSQNRLHFHPIFIFACYAFTASFTRGLPILRSNHEMPVTNVCCGI